MTIDETLLSVTPSELEHHGIKGMKWGVRRKRGANGLVSSTKRELATLKDLKKVSKMSDDELRKKTERYRNENALKRLSDRKEYQSRSNLSDAELKKRVFRLQLEDALKREIKNTNRGNLEVVNRIIKETSKIAVNKYVESGNFAPTGNPSVDLIIKEGLKYTSKQDKTIKWSDSIDIDEMLSMSPSELEHYGVKGMKWGVRRKRQEHKKISVQVRATKNTRINDTRERVRAPGPGGIALYLIEKRSYNKKINTAISKAVNEPVRNLDRKALRDARKTIKLYDNLEVSTGNDWTRVN